MSTVWIVDRSHGQLGNRLMLLAAAYAWCLQDGHELHYPGLHRYAHHFPALDGQWFNSPTTPRRCGLGRKWREVFQRRFVDVFRGLVRMKVIGGRLRPPDGSRACSLRPTNEGFPARARGSGWARRYVIFSWRFTNPVGLVKYREEIRALLRPQPEVEADAAAFVRTLPARLGADGDRTARIAVHIRRRDYRTFLGGKHFHSLARYKAEMAAVATALGEGHGIATHFILFSDEPVQADEFAGMSVTISGGTMMQDLVRMSKLDGAIGPVSTFSAFAMYLADATVYHFGPSIAEDGFDWVYSGLAVVRTAAELALEVAGAESRDAREDGGEEKSTKMKRKGAMQGPAT